MLHCTIVSAEFDLLLYTARRGDVLLEVSSVLCAGHLDGFTGREESHGAVSLLCELCEEFFGAVCTNFAFFDHGFCDFVYKAAGRSSRNCDVAGV